MTKRQEAALETKRKLIAAGERLIAEKGFDAVSVEDITKACGVAKGTFYTYFACKEDIVPTQSMKPFLKMIEEAMQLEDADIYERLQYYMLHFVSFIENEGLHICRQWNCQELTAASKCESKKERKFYYDCESMEQMLTVLIQSGELAKETPVDTLAKIIETQLYGMQLCWCMSDGDFTPSEWVTRFCAIQLPGLFAPYIN